MNFLWEPVPTNKNPNCLVYNLLKDTFKIKYSDNPDFWFFTSTDEKVDCDGCVKVLFTGENMMPDFNKCDYAATFSNIKFGDRFFRYDFGFSEGLYKDVKKRKKCVIRQQHGKEEVLQLYIQKLKSGP